MPYLEKDRLKNLSAFPQYPIIITLTIIGLIIFLSRVIFITVPPFQSDDSVYTYTTYAITRGVIPYRQVFLAHPPMLYLVFAIIIKIVGTNLILTRLYSIGIFLVTFFLAYSFAKVLLRDNKNSERTALLSASVYAFYPIIITLSIPVSAEFILTTFTLTSAIFYVKSIYSKRKLYTFSAGLFMGLALITKLTAFFFTASIILFNFALLVWQRKFKKALTDTLLVSLGITVPLLLTVLLLHVYFNSLAHFYLQTFYLQIIRPTPTLMERWSSIFFFVNSFFPLLVTGTLGALYLILDIMRGDNPMIILPVWIYAFNAISLVSLTMVFLHYFVFLTPYLSLLSILFFTKVSPLIYPRGKTETNVKPKSRHRIRTLLIFLTLLLLIVSQGLTQMGTQIPYFYESPYTQIELYIGDYVNNITNFDDKIWTSEGGIAFFAQRLIAAPTSSKWPMQAHFDDVFNNTSDEGHKGMGMNLSPKQFAEAWEKEEVKVIIFIFGTGWVPYPDNLLWNGFKDHEGVANYVEEKYELKNIVIASEVPYVYEIWVRK